MIAATGELEASRELTQAAENMSRAPASIQLRYLQTLVEIAAEKNSTIVFPLPIELLEGLDLVVRRLAKNAEEASASRTVVIPPAPTEPSPAAVPPLPPLSPLPPIVPTDDAPPER